MHQAAQPEHPPTHLAQAIALLSLTSLACACFLLPELEADRGQSLHTLFQHEPSSLKETLPRHLQLEYNKQQHLQSPAEIRAPFCRELYSSLGRAAPSSKSLHSGKKVGEKIETLTLELRNRDRLN